MVKKKLLANISCEGRHTRQNIRQILGFESLSEVVGQLSFSRMLVSQKTQSCGSVLMACDSAPDVLVGPCKPVTASVFKNV